MISNREYIKRLIIGSITVLLALIGLALWKPSGPLATFMTVGIVICGGLFNLYLRNTYIRKIREGDPNFYTFKAGMTGTSNQLWVESSFRVPIIPLFFLPLIKSTLDEAEELKKQREQKEAKES